MTFDGMVWIRRKINFSLFFKENIFLHLREYIFSRRTKQDKMEKVFSRKVFSFEPNTHLI